MSNCADSPISLDITQQRWTMLSRVEEVRENRSYGITGFRSQGLTTVFSGQEDGGGQKAAAHKTMPGDYYNASI